jgi:hypothetical protein
VTLCIFKFLLQLNRTHQSTKSQWTAQCARTLHLATSLLPFAAFMRAEREIHSVILSLIVELPLVKETAVTLAELIPDTEMLSAEMQDKLRRLLKEWQGAFLTDRAKDAAADAGGDSQRGQTMALVYHEVACQHQKLIEQRCRAFGSYEEAVFVSENPLQNTNLMIGSRPFESYRDFIKLLDTVYSVSFSHELNSSRQVKQLPLLETFAREIRRQELNSELRYDHSVHRNISVSADSDAVCPPPPKPSIIENTIRPLPKPSGVKLAGLFRSRSIGCLDDEVDIAVKSSLHPQEIDVLTPDAFAKASTIVPRNSRLILSSRNTNNNNAGSSQRHSPVRGFERCTSLVDFNDVEDSCGKLTSEYLIESVLSDSALKKTEFTGNYVISEKMAEWMNANTGKYFGDWLKLNPQAAAISVRISSKMLTYALWLIENRSFFVPPRSSDIVVAVVQQQSNPAPLPASLRHTPSTATSSQMSELGNGQKSSGPDKRKKMTSRRNQTEETSQDSARAKKMEEEEYGTSAWGTKRFPMHDASAPDNSANNSRLGYAYQ